MNSIVQRFGGSSVANAGRLRNVADITTRTYSQNNDVVVVVSAQGGTIDDLIAKTKEVSPHPPKRGMDILLTADEQMSASLLAMTIEQMGFPVVSLLSWQAGFLTDTSYGSARIKRMTPDRIKKKLDKRNIIIVTSSQRINRYNDMTTPGRGGSDTSTVTIAAVMHADLCQIYAGTEGVYIADPHEIKNAEKIDVISYDEMLELATLGAQVLNDRSVEMTKRYNIELEVLSSYNRAPGTVMKEATRMEKTLISGIAKDDGVAHVAIIGVSDRPGLAFKVFSKLSAKNVNVDIVLQSIGRNGTGDISFTVSEDHLQATMEVLIPYVEQIGASSVAYDEDVTKASIVDAGVETRPDVATMMFEALFESNINIQTISASRIRISVLIRYKDANEAIAVIHDESFPEVVDQ